MATTTFAAGVSTQGVYRGELQGPVLGMATDVYDVQGKPAAAGEKGELVCTVPFPSKPIGFWGDVDNAKYPPLPAVESNCAMFALLPANTA